MQVAALRTVLIADDDAISRTLVRAVLTPECGFTLLEAQDGREALAIARQEKPDLVLLDILMPWLSGLEVCRELKAGPETSHIPVVILTALAQQEHRQFATEAGADAYVAKPFSPQALVETIRRMTNGR